MFENPRRGRQARNFTKNVSKILDLKSSSEQMFCEKRHWMPLTWYRLLYLSCCCFSKVVCFSPIFSLSHTRHLFTNFLTRQRVNFLLRVHVSQPLHNGYPQELIKIIVNNVFITIILSKDVTA